MSVRQCLEEEKKKKKQSPQVWKSSPGPGHFFKERQKQNHLLCSRTMGNHGGSVPYQGTTRNKNWGCRCVSDDISNICWMTAEKKCELTPGILGSG